MLIKISHFFLDKKKIFALFTICLSISLLSLYLVSHHFQKIKLLQMQYNDLENTALTSLKKRREKRDFLDKYSKHTSDRLMNFLEKKTFLKNRCVTLEYFFNHPAYFQNSKIDHLISALKKNKFSFVIEDPIEKNNIRETRLVMTKPVLCDFSDICEILSYLENLQINTFTPLEKTPQILVYDLNINETPQEFELTFKILQREFLK